MIDEEFPNMCANAYLDDVPIPLRGINKCGNVSIGLSDGDEFGEYFGYYCNDCIEIVKQYVIDNS